MTPPNAIKRFQIIGAALFLLVVGGLAVESASVGKSLNIIPGNQMALHDMLFRDWGTDLPIRGGNGQSRQDPIIITAS